MIFSGNNPTEICQLCKGTGGTKCSTNDPSAGYDGAFRCLQKGDGDVAFLRHDTLLSMINNVSSVGFNNFVIVIYWKFNMATMVNYAILKSKMADIAGHRPAYNM